MLLRRLSLKSPFKKMLDVVITGELRKMRIILDPNLQLGQASFVNPEGKETTKIGHHLGIAFTNYSGELCKPGKTASYVELPFNSSQPISLIIAKNQAFQVSKAKPAKDETIVELKSDEETQQWKLQEGCALFFSQEPNPIQIPTTKTVRNITEGYNNTQPQKSNNIPQTPEIDNKALTPTTTIFRELVIPTNNTKSEAEDYTTQPNKP